MKCFAFTIVLLALGFAASSPARADYAVVQFGDGWCQVWWDSGDTPWGVDWRKLAIGLPTRYAAELALADARAQAICR